ncbi:hypothetical protein F4774DRAFT_427072 [Daldinia eschscholtzii]|nr:hypothetical protein F4774DRAFT_427072 [Daldinia eschscholtzii]
MSGTKYGVLRQTEDIPLVEEPTCNVRLKWIAKLPERWQKFIKYTVWILLALTAAIQALLLSYEIAVIVKRNSIPSPSPTDFNLYKNTRFEDCTPNPLSQSNCNFLDRRQFEGAVIFGWKASWKADSWCEYASCLRDWKIVPSKPRDSAYGLTPLAIWFYLKITAINVLLDLRGPYPPKKCKGPHFSD